MTTDPLLQPFRLGHLTLRNRILITGHEPGYAVDGMPMDRYRAYHVARARGGVALTMTIGSASVARDSPPSGGGVQAFRDEIVPWMRRMADECHEHGCAVMIQLTHHGRRTRWDRGDWLPTISSSPEREVSHHHAAKMAEDWDITRIVQDYADAAERMKEAGLDGVEFLATGHLIDQFWSPRSNTLDAPWGGGSENRMRLAFDVLRAARERVGPDFLLGMRYAVDELAQGGVNSAGGLDISHRLKESGLVDFLNVTRGHIDTDAGITDMIPVQGMRNAPHLEAAGTVRAATGIPVFHAAKVPDVATARHAIASGLVDMIGMTRAHLADPDIVSHIAAGQEGRIRPCVGANFCLDRRFQGGEALCIHNPSTGREAALPHTIAPAVSSGGAARQVLIVGAGPAGLEAARVAALRGHAVTVYEAAPDPGGQIRLAARSERRREMLSIVGWRMDECERLGVRFCFGTVVEPEAVIAADHAVVILATGGMPHSVPLSEGDDLTVSSWDILAGDVAPGQNVLLFDNAGDVAGLQAAEMIALTGARLEVVTPGRALAPEVMPMTLTPFLRALQAHAVTVTVARRLTAIRRRDNRLVAELGSDWGPAASHREVTQVVVNNGTIPLDDLYFALKPLSSNLGQVDQAALLALAPQQRVQNEAGRFRLFRIGDAVASRNIHAAVLDANRLARAL